MEFEAEEARSMSKETDYRNGIEELKDLIELRQDDGGSECLLERECQDTLSTDLGFSNMTHFGENLNFKKEEVMKQEGFLGILSALKEEDGSKMQLTLRASNSAMSLIPLAGCLQQMQLRSSFDAAENEDQRRSMEDWGRRSNNRNEIIAAGKGQANQLNPGALILHSCQMAEYKREIKEKKVELNSMSFLKEKELNDSQLNQNEYDSCLDLKESLNNDRLSKQKILFEKTQISSMERLVEEIRFHKPLRTVSPSAKPYEMGGQKQSWHDTPFNSQKNLVESFRRHALLLTSKSEIKALSTERINCMLNNDPLIRRNLKEIRISADEKARKRRECGLYSVREHQMMIRDNKGYEELLRSIKKDKMKNNLKPVEDDGYYVVKTPELRLEGGDESGSSGYLWNLLFGRWKR